MIQVLILFHFHLLQASRLGDLKADHEPALTYEGDNNVLAITVASCIVKGYHDVMAGKRSPTGSPLKSLQFLEHIKSVTSSGSTIDIDADSTDSILKILKQLACYLTIKLSDKLSDKLKENDGNEFIAKTQVHAFYARNLMEVFFDVLAIERYLHTDYVW